MRLASFALAAACCIADPAAAAETFDDGGVHDIGGGTFSASSTQLLRAFGESRLTINGGSFFGGQSSVLQVIDDASVVIRGGTFAGSIRSGAGGNDDGGRLDIFGGTFGALPGSSRGQIVNIFGSVITIHGRSFNLPFGEITTDFTGVLTGVLANGDALDVDLIQQLNNADTGRIVLVQSPVPEPGSAALLAIGLALLLVRGLTGFKPPARTATA